MSTTNPDSSSSSMSPDSVNTSSLESLQTDGQRKILDIVDQLRRQGLDGVVQLPQIVVCGDQSAGKSSVLEAITEIPFPRNVNLCTRFATEIILRRHQVPSIVTRINPDKDRTDTEKKQLRKFSRKITEFSQLPSIIEEATKAMGLKDIGASNQAFSKDVLTVEIAGPTRPQLTLVDTPGLIHTSTPQQTDEDVKIIKDLVLRYITNPRTIILAVITAKNDAANQIILKHCREMDPNGKRTLGVITKPDVLQQGSSEQATWLSYAGNKNIYLELGWHMVKNLAEDETHQSFFQREMSERSFFSQQTYDTLPAYCKGIAALRTRLSGLLLKHLKSELPNLKIELVGKLDKTQHDIDQLGVKRSSVLEQRMFLTDIGQKINEVMKAAIRGQYDSNFFGPVNMDAEVDSKDNLRRIRAVVQHLNLSFSSRMHLTGHKYEIRGDSDEDNKESRTKPKKAVFPRQHQPIPWTQSQAINWVEQTLKRSRGLELPGNFNPLVVAQLFWEQSSPWNELARQHVEKVATCCKEFVNIVLAETSTEDVRVKLSNLCVDAALDKSLQEAKAELAKITEDKSRHPSTYNHYFTSKIQGQRKTKYAKNLETIAKSAQVTVQVYSGAYQSYVDPEKLKNNFNGDIEQNMDRFSAEDALDSATAYYADELKYFINCVSKQVIERHLVDTLDGKVLSPHIIAGMSDTQIEMIAAEAPEVSRNREMLEDRKKVLEIGLQTFKEALGGFI